MKTSADVVSQRTAAAKVLAALQIERSGIEGQCRVAEAGLGPVKYLERSTATGAWRGIP
jgi:hypothetical protein